MTRPRTLPEAEQDRSENLGAAGCAEICDVSTFFSSADSDYRVPNGFGPLAQQKLKEL